MTRMRRNGAVGAVLWCFAAVATAGQPPLSERQAEALKLIEDLNDPDYGTREKATKKLIELAQEDEWVASKLNEATGSESLETAHRANHILEQAALARARGLIADLASPDKKTRDAATEALLELARRHEGVCQLLLAAGKNQALSERARSLASGIYSQVRQEQGWVNILEEFRRREMFVPRPPPKGPAPKGAAKKAAPKKKAGPGVTPATAKKKLLELLEHVRRHPGLPSKLRDQLRRAILRAYAKAGTRPLDTRSLDEILAPVRALLDRASPAPPTRGKRVGKKEGGSAR